MYLVLLKQGAVDVDGKSLKHLESNFQECYLYDDYVIVRDTQHHTNYKVSYNYIAFIKRAFS